MSLLAILQIIILLNPCSLSDDELATTLYKTESIKQWLASCLNNWVFQKYCLRAKFPINLAFGRQKWNLVGKSRTAGRYLRLWTRIKLRNVLCSIITSFLFSENTNERRGTSHSQHSSTNHYHSCPCNNCS